MTSDKIVGKEVSIMGSGEDSVNLVSRKRDNTEEGEGKPTKRAKAEDDDEVWLISKKKTSYEGEYVKERVVCVIVKRQEVVLDPVLRMLYKNLKMLPKKTWESLLESTDYIDKAYVALGKGLKNDVNHRIYRCRHWSLLLEYARDWYAREHKSLMQRWRNFVEGKCHHRFGEFFGMNRLTKFLF